MNFIVIGDCILDHNIYTIVQTPKRIDYNTEYNIIREEYKLGACGNLVTNLQSLGANKVFLFSAIGDDMAGRRMSDMANSFNIGNFLKIVPSYNTTVKHRYYHDNKCIFQTANHINKELLLPISLCDEIEQVLIHTKIDCIVLCESEKSSIGLLSIPHCQQIIALATKYNIPTMVDPKEDIHKYRGCTIIKPNRDEAYALMNMSNDTPLMDVHNAILQQLQCKYSYITLSEQGISIYDGKDELRDKCHDELIVVDPIGAGDIITSITALLLNKVDMKDSAHIAVNMASKSVEKTGVVTVSNCDIVNFCFTSKHIQLNELPMLRTIFHNKKIGITTGCFDLLHNGHILSLGWCKENCDILVVCLNSDESIQHLKGKQRPIQSIDRRLSALTALDIVDYIIVFDQPTAIEIIKTLKPNILMKGGDYRDKHMLESDFVDTTLIGPYLDGVSTTNIIKNM